MDARFDQMGGGLDADRLEQDLGVWRTEQSGKSLAIACAASLQLDGTELSPRAPEPVPMVLALDLGAGSGGDLPAPDRGGAQRQPVRRSGAGRTGCTRSSEADRLAWRCSPIMRLRGRNAGVSATSRLTGDAAAEQALRFAIYHLNSAANPADERVSIGARALTGDAYLGHVFWDTEIYVLPFYIATWPEAARALLMYRYHTLPGARAKAAAVGWRGAMYAWESADTGEETTPRAGHRPAWRADPGAVRHAGTAHHRRCRLCGLAILAGHRRRLRSWRCGCGDPAGDRPVLGQPRRSRGRWRVPYPRRDRPGRIPRDHRRQRLYKRNGALEHPARHRGGRPVARPLAGALGRTGGTARPR